MAGMFENIGKTITAPIGGLWQGAMKGLAPGYVQQFERQAKMETEKGKEGGRTWQDRAITLFPYMTREGQLAMSDLFMEKDPIFNELKGKLGGAPLFGKEIDPEKMLQIYDKAIGGMLEGSPPEPSEEDRPLYDMLIERRKDLYRQFLKMGRAEKKGISTTRTAPSAKKGFQFGDLGKGFGLPSMSGGRPTMGAKGGMPPRGGAFGGLGAEQGVPEYRPPTAGPIEPTPVQTKRPGFLGRKEVEFPVGFGTPKTPRTLEEFDSRFPAPKTNYERPSYLKLRSIWLDLPEEIQDKVTAALRRVGYKAVIGAEELKPYLENK